MKRISTMRGSLCHTDVPSTEIDSGDAIRQRAAESCGFNMGQDAFDSHDQMMRRGGPEQIIKDAIKRAERAGGK